jgi:hypothetical protein
MMGISEDDRIRSKNHYHNLAYDLYTCLQRSGLSPETIRSVVLPALDLRVGEALETILKANDA